ncbi:MULTISPECIES: type II toxin-antitoxin system VapC family toxin [unclassified Rhizobium]|uniref:type II toxin-antitoxin system VapC family toxin n=1 Tax=unclassified Rhizobium TaxID=2613769 RepID=UPI000DD62155|nr:type II toxin-antitoxin system VapC family toxin [Rhizobium sp. UBA1881]
MTGYLLDTNIISLFAPGRPAISPDIREWMSERGGEGSLYLSAITIAEIQRGIKKLERKGADARAAKLAEWLSGLMGQFGDHVLPVDADIAMAAGKIEEQAEASGHRQGLADVLIAATASVRNLTVVTANVRHFAPLGVILLSPDDMAAS